MIAILDVAYEGAEANAASVVASEWEDSEPVRECSARISNIAEYVPGEFFKRELPCLKEVLGCLPDPPDIIVVDGFVTLDAQGTQGLGAHLFTALGSSTPVIGVAKTGFAKATHAIEIKRGESERPLFITAMGIEPQHAARCIQSMHGEFRIPALLKRVDQLSRLPFADGST